VESDGPAAAVLAAFVFMVRQPERIGSMFPRLIAGWYQGLGELREARMKALALRALGGAVHVREIADKVPDPKRARDH
jgi:hypothetical protein